MVRDLASIGLAPAMMVVAADQYWFYFGSTFAGSFWHVCMHRLPRGESDSTRRRAVAMGIAVYQPGAGVIICRYWGGY